MTKSKYSKKSKKKYSKKSNYKRNKRNTTRRKRKKTRKRYQRGGSTVGSTVGLTDVTRSQLIQLNDIPQSKTESVTRVTETLDNPKEIERYVLEELVHKYNALTAEQRALPLIASLLYSHQFDGFHNHLIRNYHNGEKVVSISLFDETLRQSSEKLSIFQTKGSFEWEREKLVRKIDDLQTYRRALLFADRSGPYYRARVVSARSDLIIAEADLKRFDDMMTESDFKSVSNGWPFLDDCQVQNKNLNDEIESAKKSVNKPLFCVQKCSFLHEHMKDNSLVLDRSITVYRGILLGKTTQYLDGGFNNELTGFSSTTYNRYQAIYYMFASRLRDEFEGDEYDSKQLEDALSKIIILKIKLNPGTHVFYTDMCGKDETELTLLDEGSLNMGTETYIEVSKDQFLEEFDDAEYTGEDSSFPSIRLKQIECEFTPNKEQIHYSEVLFDPLSRLMV